MQFVKSVQLQWSEGQTVLSAVFQMREEEAGSSTALQVLVQSRDIICHPFFQVPSTGVD